MVKLVGDHEVLVADGKSLSLYDLKSKTIRYRYKNIRFNQFLLHPSEKYCLVHKSGVAALLETNSGNIVVQSCDENSKSTWQLSYGTAYLGFSPDGRNLFVSIHSTGRMLLSKILVCCDVCWLQ